MCLLCEIQKWSRRVATMLPWLVIPLIGLWALSQLLPPPFRFEITSPRLVCAFLLLVTLFWYEVLMPQLSAWRVRRNARIRERERLEAIQFDKLRKTAIRRCRNCLTPYRDQNPGGGRFLCSYCGHISKRPILDLPVPPGIRISKSGIVRDMVAKGGKASCGKAWSENGWMCGQDWSENGNWINGSFKDKFSYWWKNPGGFFIGDSQCLAQKLYSGVFIFACKLLTSFFLSMRWLWIKIFRVSTLGDDTSVDAQRRGILANRAENGANLHESRGERARRKAEEKRQARLEKELLEEEERKQREEVAKLVEERRRLRDERVGTDRDRGKGSASVKEKDSKKDVEKKRKERRKEKDKGSSKSDSDAEEYEKSSGKEKEKKRELDKKGEIDRREHQRTGMLNSKVHSIEMGHGLKGNTVNNYYRGNAGSRCLDHMRGTFLSPSKAFSKGNFFGKGSSTAAAATVSKENKSNSLADHVQSPVSRRDSCAPEHMAKLTMSGGDRSRTVLSGPQQLFTRSSDAPPSSHANVINRPDVKYQAGGQCSQLTTQPPLTRSFDNPINFGFPSLFTLPIIPNGSTVSAGFPSATHSISPPLVEVPCDFSLEETDIFEDPCYDPDPVSLLGPVSESLDNFQLDMGVCFVTDVEIQRPHGQKNVSASSNVSRPSPIESPMSKLRISDEKNASSHRFQSPLRTQDVHTYSMDDSSNTNGKGAWQMWNTSPLGQDGLALVHGTTSWLLPLELNRSNKEDIVHPSSHRSMASLFAKEEQVLSGAHSPQKFFIGNGQDSTIFQPSSGGKNHLSHNPLEETAHNEVIHRSPRATVVNHPFEPSPANIWPKKEWGAQGSGEGAGNTTAARSPIGGLYTTPVVQSLWSYQ